MEALADLDPEMAAMLSVQQRIADDPTRIPGIFNPGQVLQGIQDYTGRQSQAGIISDARNMTPEQFQRQFGISTVYTRALADAQDAARRGDARAMPDSEARAERERQSIESLQSQVAANVAEQQRRNAEQQRQNALRQKLLDDLNLSEALANISPGPGAGRAAAGTADYTEPLPEGTGWWDETAAKVTGRQAREINETYGPLLKQLGLGPITSLDEFINLVKEEASKSLETGGGMGTLGMIYTDYFDGRDQWEIFGDANLTDYTLPTGTNPFGSGPLIATPQPVPTPTTGPIPGLGSIPSALSNVMSNQPFGTYQGPQEDNQSSGFWENFFKFMSAGNPIYGPQSARQYTSLGDVELDPTNPSQARIISQTTKDERQRLERERLGLDDPTIIEESGADAETDTDGTTSYRTASDLDAERRFRDAATQILQGQPLDSVFGTLRHSNSLSLQVQSEALQKMQQQLIGLEASGISNDAARLRVAEDSIRLAMSQGQFEINKMEADRQFAYQQQRLQLEALRAQEEGRQFDQELLYGYRQAAADVDEANRQLELQKWQTSVENPFNVAAMNLLSGPPQVRAFQSAQQQNVDQASLDRALQTAQHHAGRQGIGVGDPQIQQMARQLIPQMTTPSERAAMEAIAQGVSSMTQPPQQQMRTQTAGGPSQNIFRDALQQGQTQTLSSTPMQPSGTQTFIPQGLRDINFSPDPSARFGQPTDYSSLFKGGLPTLADIGQLSETERGFLEATAASTGTSRADLMKRASDVTPTIQGRTMPEISRIRNRYTGRNSGGAF